MIRKKILLSIILSLCICAVPTYGYSYFNSKKTEEGIAYIKKLEAKNTESLEKELHEKRNQELHPIVQKEEIDPFSLFDDFAFLGDSRVMGFSAYQFLPENRILANSGATILSIDTWLDALKELNPSKIYLSYGINDLISNIGGSTKEYAKMYEKKIKKILEVCPHAKIYILSILPPNPMAIQLRPVLGNYQEYNDVLEKMCLKNSWQYIDCESAIFQANYDIYQSDGIHFLKDFYEVWAQELVDSKK